ncbi:serine/threonine protein kinase [Nannizzia gypsea CBS 118893]|uniref:Serine/threonine protein kinase n=1 Tax=Arthroderma gypseum (strain ATCC MYA-4604 / CBS 118893) TaxID=535722 RepID=E4V013_ARTGP|nr:serine/threonine protein kinase [Nannizzia gypsea CBS 118893]EFR02950.1 serine/threonine protein kinase [Nannizzia gypsea CBS 118893]
MERIAWGATAAIDKTKKLTVMKQPFPEARHEVTFERQVYERLGAHPRIARFIRPLSHTFEMEYYQMGCIDQARQKIEFEIPYLKWAEQIAEGPVFIHSKGVIHYDLRSPNILVTETLDVVLADFASSSMDGVRVSSVYNKTRYRQPSFDEFKYESYQYTIQDDVFAFGSVIYGLITAAEPYQERTSEEVIKLYAAGAVATKCWCGEYSNAAQVLEDISQY